MKIYLQYEDKVFNSFKDNELPQKDDVIVINQVMWGVRGRAFNRDNNTITLFVDIMPSKNYDKDEVINGLSCLTLA